MPSVANLSPHGERSELTRMRPGIIRLLSRNLIVMTEIIIHTVSELWKLNMHSLRATQLCPPLVVATQQETQQGGRIVTQKVQVPFW